MAYILAEMQQAYTNAHDPLDYMDNQAVAQEFTRYTQYESWYEAYKHQTELNKSGIQSIILSESAIIDMTTKILANQP